MSRRVLAVHYTPPGVIGGVEHVLQQQIAQLRSRGFEVQVVSGRPSSAEPDAVVLPGIDAALPANVALEHELLAGAVSPRFAALTDDIWERLAPLAATADVLLVHNAFTLHFSLPLTAALWRIARMRYPGTVIAWCHDLSWTNPLYLPGMHDGYPWELLRVRAPNTRYVTISAERQRELLALWHGNGARSVQVVPNGVDADSVLGLGDTVRRVVRRWRLYERDVVLLLPVRITRRKNIEVGIRTLAALREAGTDAVFLVSGPQAPHHPQRSSSYLAELQELSTSLGVGAETVFLAAELGENLDLESVHQLYRVADALFFPSAQEGFGLPVIEAALARLPVVVSDIPIFREVGGTEALYVSLDESPDRIARVITDSVNSPVARMRRRVLQAYSWETLFDRSILPLFAAPGGDL